MLPIATVLFKLERASVEVAEVDEMVSVLQCRRLIRWKAGDSAFRVLHERRLCCDGVRMVE